MRAKGETDPEIPDGLMASSPWKRIAVFIAGPAMNFLVAIILYIAIYASLSYLPDRTHVQLLDVVDGTPADVAGLQAGDMVFRVDDEPINSTLELRTIIYSNLGNPLDISYERDGVLTTTTLTPLLNPGENGAVGIYMAPATKPFNFLAAIPEGFVSTYEYCRELFSMIGNLITGQIPAEEGRLLGFKGMYDLYSEIRDESIPGTPVYTNIFSYLIMITISLGLFNLLPIPAWMEAGSPLHCLKSSCGVASPTNLNWWSTLSALLC